MREDGEYVQRHAGYMCIVVKLSGYKNGLFTWEYDLFSRKAPRTDRGHSVRQLTILVRGIPSYSDASNCKQECNALSGAKQLPWSFGEAFPGGNLGEDASQHERPDDEIRHTLSGTDDPRWTGR